MVDETKWHPRAICPKCGWHTYAPFSDVFHVPEHVCPDCGYVKHYDPAIFRVFKNIKRWEVKTMRYVSTARLFNPLTWGKGYWEEQTETISPG